MMCGQALEGKGIVQTNSNGSSEQDVVPLQPIVSDRLWSTHSLWPLQLANLAQLDKWNAGYRVSLGGQISKPATAK